MSRHQALKLWRGRRLQDDLAAQGIIVKSPSSRGIAEEAPGAYKDIDAVVEAAEMAGLAKRVARLRPAGVYQVYQGIGVRALDLRQRRQGLVA
jgi:tRNA-splicing ligase RtcB